MWKRVVGAVDGESVLVKGDAAAASGERRLLDPVHQVAREVLPAVGRLQVPVMQRPGSQRAEGRRRLCGPLGSTGKPAQPPSPLSQALAGLLRERAGPCGCPKLCPVAGRSSRPGGSW